MYGFLVKQQARLDEAKIHCRLIHSDNDPASTKKPTSRRKVDMRKLDGLIWKNTCQWLSMRGTATANPCNEYWLGRLDASGDPVAACCSTIGELQNPEINPFLLSTNPKLVELPTIYVPASH